MAPMQGQPGTAKQEGADTGFADVVKKAIDAIDGTQQSAASGIQGLVTGKSQDVLSVVQQVADADLSFKLLVGVRNKLIEAYKETMRMQV